MDEAGAVSVLSLASRRLHLLARGARVGPVASRFGLILSLAALCVMIGESSPYFFTANNALNIGRASAYTGIASAVTTLVLIGGAIDLSIGAVMALTGIIAARMLSAGQPVWLTLIACLLSGCIVGAINGGVVTFIGINPLITTIGTQFVVRGFAYTLSLNSGGEEVITNRDFLFIGQNSVFGLPVSVWILLIALLVTGWVLSQTRFGRHVFAIGGNAQAARLAGINISLRRMQIYTLSGLGSACSGVVLGAYTGAGIAYAATGTELVVIAAVILGGTSLLGGRGSVFGTFLGIAIFGVIANGIILFGLGNNAQLMVTGSVLLVAVVIDEMRAKFAAR